MKKYINDHDVENILERIDDTVEHRLYTNNNASFVTDKTHFASSQFLSKQTLANCRKHKHISRVRKLARLWKTNIGACYFQLRHSVDGLERSQDAQNP